MRANPTLTLTLTLTLALTLTLSLTSDDDSIALVRGDAVEESLKGEQRRDEQGGSGWA